jgi:hypothetical protein
MGTTRYPFDHLPADLKTKLDEANASAEEMYGSQFPAAKPGADGKPPS